MDSASDPSDRGKRVLVVEDDPASRRALVSLLRLNGFEALFAVNVAEAMALIDTAPACVLLDLMLPDGTGAIVLQHVRKQCLPTRVTPDP